MLSVVVPLYNKRNSIIKTIQSVLRQTVSDFELIVVDDGSTDNSQEIIDEYCKKDDRLSCLIKENERSAAKARYYALERISSEWVMSVDADDAIEPEFLEKIIKRYWETEADCVTGYRIGCAHELEGEDWRLPENNFDMNQILSGRECCLMTLGGWKIGGRELKSALWHCK